MLELAHSMQTWLLKSSLLKIKLNKKQTLLILSSNEISHTYFRIMKFILIFYIRISFWYLWKTQIFNGLNQMIELNELVNSCSKKKPVRTPNMISSLTIIKLEWLQDWLQQLSTSQKPYEGLKVLLQLLLVWYNTEIEYGIKLWHLCIVYMYNKSKRYLDLNFWELNVYAFCKDTFYRFQEVSINVSLRNRNTNFCCCFKIN